MTRYQSCRRGSLLPDAYRRFRRLVGGAWVIAIVLVMVSIGLDATYVLPHWVFPLSLALGIFLVSLTYAKRLDAVLTELGEDEKAA